MSLLAKVSPGAGSGADHSRIFLACTCSGAIRRPVAGAPIGERDPVEGAGRELPARMDLEGGAGTGRRPPAAAGPMDGERIGRGNGRGGPQRDAGEARRDRHGDGLHEGGARRRARPPDEGGVAGGLIGDGGEEGGGGRRDRRPRPSDAPWWLRCFDPSSITDGRPSLEMDAHGHPQGARTAPTEGKMSIVAGWKARAT
jgi:hypothetical protein